MHIDKMHHLDCTTLQRAHVKPRDLIFKRHGMKTEILRINVLQTVGQAFALIGLVAVCSAPAWAEHHQQGHHGASAKVEAPADSKSEYSTATIKKVDAAKRRLLLSHGPIPNLGMSAMTMGFEVAAGVDFSGLTAGDSIQFKADKLNGNYTVTDVRKP